MKLCKKTMIESFRNISFNDERRGEQDFNYYTELLKEDLENLPENKGKYEEKFINKVMDIYHRQSRCTSAMIVGPANYDLRRHEKAWNSRDKAFEHFWYWREKYFKAVNRVRTLSPEAELDNLALEIPTLELKRDRMKEVNKLFKKSKDSEALEILNEMNLKEDSKNEVIENRGFFSFRVTSLTTKIRERKKKVEIMKNRIKVKEKQKPVKFKGGSIYIENDRVIISHDEKPSSEIIQEIKKNGFRWSPKCKNWCRKHTANARYSARYLLQNVFGGVINEN